MNYIFLGGAGEVGGSCMLLSVADRYLLFDCGIRVNKTGRDALPDLELLKQTTPTLDAIFISHAHADHIGALPLAHAAYPQATIYATRPTQMLSGIMLNNAVDVMMSEGQEAFFTKEVVETTLARIQTLGMGNWIDLWDGFRVLFIRSGHILGAISIMLQTPEGTFFYSGDVSTFRQKTIDGLDNISALPSPDFMVCEATYGDDIHPSRTVEETKLAKAVAEVIENSGNVLIPSFALGRAQEIILILKQAMMSKLIPAFPVVTDGLVNAICSMYASMPEMLSEKTQNFLTNSQQPLFFSDYVRAARMGEQEAILNDKTPKCIIASSGMLTGGASVTYAKGLCSDPKNAIFLSGYQDAESPGRRLQELQPGDTLAFPDGISMQVKCQVERFHLSAHSDQSQLVSVIKTLNPKALALVHGEETAIAALQEKLSKSFPVIVPKNKTRMKLSDQTEWLSPEAQAKLNRRVVLDVNVKIIDDNKLLLEGSALQSDRWKTFADGEHKATLKGDRLIIRKT